MIYSTPEAPLLVRRALPLWLTVSIAVLTTVSLWPGLLINLGLHGDEAYVGLQAHKLLHGGPWHMDGMNSHTGPLHQWLVALNFFLWGPSVTALRAVGAVCNGLAVALYAHILTALLGRARGLWATVMFITLPVTLTLGGVAFEHWALNPLFAMLAWLVVYCGRWQHSHKRSFVAGAILGLGTWTHLVFVAVPVGFAAAAVQRLGWQGCKKSGLRWALLGWLMVEAAPLVRFSARIKIRHGGAGIVDRLRHMPEVLLHTWQGKYAALRTVGYVPQAVPVVIFALAVAAALGLCIALLGHRPAAAPRPTLVANLISLGVALCAGVVTVATIAPYTSDRFVLSTLPLVVPLLTAGLWALPKLWLSPVKSYKLAHVLCASMVAGQLHYFVTAIAKPWRHGNAIGNAFDILHVPETSNHYLDTLPVYGALSALGHREVVCQNFIGWCLRFYDLDRGRLHVRLRDQEETFEPRARPGSEDVVVIYSQGYRNDNVDVPDLVLSPVQTIPPLKHFTILQAKTVVPEPEKT